MPLFSLRRRRRRPTPASDGTSAWQAQAPVVEQVRQRLLQPLVAVDDLHAAMLCRRIRHAGDVLSLWFLRSEVLALLALHMGEARALALVQDITAPLQEHLPGGLRARR